LGGGDKTASLTSSRVSSPTSLTAASLLMVIMMTVMIQFVVYLHTDSKTLAGNCKISTISIRDVRNTSRITHTHNSKHDYVSANTNAKRRKHEFKTRQQNPINETITVKKKKKKNT
jgi:hypothetical protein